MSKVKVGLLFTLLVLLSLAIGAQTLTFESFMRLDRVSSLVFWQVRIPRTISLILAGSSMSIAGLLMQTVSQNRFAAPSTVGTVEAAKLGILIALWGIPNVTLQGKLWVSFLTAVIMTLVFFILMQRLKIRQIWAIPLFGVIYSQMINAMATAIAYRFDLVQSMSTWQQGNFALIQTGSYEWLGLSILVLFIIWGLRQPLTIMQLGKDASESLGIAYETMWYAVIACVCLICAVNVMIVGTLPFIGVVVPNLVRLHSSDSLTRSYFSVAFAGSIFVLLCDILARSIIMPYEVPVSVIIAVIGGSIFIYLLLKKGRAT